MHRGRALPLSILLLTLIAVTASSATPMPRGKLHILDAKKVGRSIVFAGYVEKGYMEIPVAGYIEDGKAHMYILGPYGIMTRVKKVNESLAVAVGSVRSRGGMAAIYALLGPGRAPRALLLRAKGAELYGGDALVKGSSIIVASTLVKTSIGVNTSATTYESDCLVVLLDNGVVRKTEVFGSREYDDYPSILLEEKNGIIVIGETWSHAASESAIFVARLGENFRLNSARAYDTSGEDTASDAIIMDDRIIIAGSTSGEKTQALVIVEGKTGWEAYSSTFTGEGHADRIYVDGRSAVVLGTGGFGEKAVKYMYAATLDGKLSVYSSRGHLLFPLEGGRRPLSITENGTIIDGDRALCIAGRCGGGITVDVLDASSYWGKYWRKIDGIRRIKPLFVEKEPIELYLEQVSPSSYTVSVPSVPVEWTSGVYEERSDWGYRIQVFIGRNIPALMVLLPLSAAALAVWIAVRKRR